MRSYVIGAALMLASWAGSFGIAYGVTEWRGGETETIVETITERVTEPIIIIVEDDTIQTGQPIQFYGDRGLDIDICPAARRNSSQSLIARFC